MEMTFAEKVFVRSVQGLLALIFLGVLLWAMRFEPHNTKLAITGMIGVPLLFGWLYKHTRRMFAFLYRRLSV